MRRQPLSLSLTGSGHLLVYQLGACRSLLQQHLEIGHCAGASGGAIVATILAWLPHRLDEYANRFIAQQGGGLTLLREFLNDQQDVRTATSSTKLHIATTRCSDGRGKLFSFAPIAESPTRWQEDRDHLLRCVEASCQIPPTFHPYDLISPSTYPDEHGILLNDGLAHVDGGIATPAPLPPTQNGTHQRIIISPVSGSSTVSRISPNTEKRLLEWTVPHDMRIHLSLSNVRALQNAAGYVSSTKLKEWYERGQRDARIEISKLDNKN